MATYVNDLRLTELATGEGSGTWGTTTNTNLELIGEALGYGTQDCFASDADATTTVADGATDPARAMYFKVTSSATLTATRTLTIAPNTVSRVMLIENATTGSQSIAISQGSGGNVTIASGQTKMVYLDGAGATGAVVDALADLELGTITVANLTATTADINGGTIDGVTIGGSSAGAITGTTGQFNTSLNVDGTVTADGLTVDGETILTKTGTNASPHIKLTESGDTREFNIFNDGSGNGRLVLADTDDTPDSEIVLADNGILQFKTANTERFNIGSGGDISFFEDTGTTPKFFWDASAESLGIGTSSPTSGGGLTLSSSTTAQGFIDFKHTVDGDSGFIGNAKALITGATTNQLGVRGGTNGIAFSVAATEAARIDSSGNVGIGTSSPAAKLEVSTGSADIYANLRLYNRSSGNHTRWGINCNAGDNTKADVALINGVSLSDNTSNSINIGGGESGSGFCGVSQITFRTTATPGTAETASERMRIDSSGNLLVGTTAVPSSGVSKISVQQTGGDLSSTTVTRANMTGIVTKDADSPTNNYGNGIWFNSGTLMAGIASARVSTTNWGTDLRFYTHPTSVTNQDETFERMRIDSSGNLLVGKTSNTFSTSGFVANANGMSATRNGGACVQINRTGTDGNIQEFYNDGTIAGSVSVAGSATAYNTSSDARLKENIADAEDAGAKVDAIQVRQFDWKADGSHQDYGMIAQELMTVAPEAVSGDPESDDMMGVDYSKLVPMLVKEIQSLRARVHALEDK